MNFVPVKFYNLIIDEEPKFQKSDSTFNYTLGFSKTNNNSSVINNIFKT